MQQENVLILYLSVDYLSTQLPSWKKKTFFLLLPYFHFHFQRPSVWLLLFDNYKLIIFHCSFFEILLIKKIKDGMKVTDIEIRANLVLWHLFNRNVSEIIVITWIGFIKQTHIKIGRFLIFNLNLMHLANSFYSFFFGVCLYAQAM